MTDKEREDKTKKQMRDMLKAYDLTVDKIGKTIERRFLQPMIEEAELYADEMMEDYDFLVSPEVKEIILQDFMRVTANIKAMKYVNKHHPDAIPSLGGTQGGYADAIIRKI